MKKLLVVFLVFTFVSGASLVNAQSTTAVRARVGDSDSRFGQFIGASDSKLEAIVGLILDLSAEGLKKSEIVNRIRAKRQVAKTNRIGDVINDFNKFRIKNKALRRGTSGEDVSSIQRVINNLGLGIPEIDEDGRFGPGTENAIKAFQRFMGLFADGIVGPKTRLKFSEKLGEFKIKNETEDGKLEIEMESDDTDDIDNDNDDNDDDTDDE